MSGVFLQGSNFILNSHWQRMRVQCLHILTNTLLSDFLILAIFVGVKWQVIMVLIYISLRTDDLSIFSSAFGLAVHILWREVSISFARFRIVFGCKSSLLEEEEHLQQMTPVPSDMHRNKRTSASHLLENLTQNRVQT